MPSPPFTLLLQPSVLSVDLECSGSTEKSLSQDADVIPTTRNDLQLHVQWQDAVNNIGKMERQSMKHNNDLARQLIRVQAELQAKSEIVADLRTTANQGESSLDVEQVLARFRTQLFLVKDEPNISDATLRALKEDNQFLQRRIQMLHENRALEMEADIASDEDSFIGVDHEASEATILELEDAGAKRMSCIDAELQRQMELDTTVDSLEEQRVAKNHLLEALQERDKQKLLTVTERKKLSETLESSLHAFIVDSNRKCDNFTPAPQAGIHQTEERLRTAIDSLEAKQRDLCRVKAELMTKDKKLHYGIFPRRDDEDDDMDGNPRDEDEEALNGDPQAKEDDQIASARFVLFINGRGIQGSSERYAESNSDALAKRMGAQASFQGAIPGPPIFLWLSEPRRYAYGSPYAFHACRRATPEKHALPRPPPLTMTGGTLGSANVLGQLAQLDRYKLRTPTRPVLPSSSRKNSRVPDRRRPSSSRYSPYAGSPRQRQDESDSEDGNEFDMRSAGQGSRNKSDQSKRKLKSSATGDASDSDTSATPVEDTTWSRIPSKYASEYPAPGRKYSEAQIKKNINNIVRIYFKKGLGVKFLYQTIVLEPVSEEHLSAFKQDPDTYGPKVDAFALDTLNLPETKHLAASAWNTELERCLTSAIYDRVESINMDGRYGIVDVGLIRKKVHNRMSELYRAIAKARPRADETVQALNKRLNLSHSAYIEHNQAIMARHHKFDRRLRTASLMRAASCEFNRPEATEYWSYVLLVLEALGYDGMSDEESDTEEVTYSGGLKVHSRCRNVLVVKWRHPQLRDLLVEVDDTPKRANQFFSKLVASPRDPPKKMARALFDPKYLAEIGPANVLALELTDAPIELREGQGSDGDDMPMNVDS
ncbi:hypothetical protein BD626DRAFT_539208 [Schizophyllum amplum]|uniref:Uncharacterized protein n=1 Tax=Schizophyllum amplum TaxID=97359 RepID=A0A550C4L3_9AGAR|nr:hypothetical protein BD626DRAFT_539208 [Auriculariopsis ampla]